MRHQSFPRVGETMYQEKLPNGLHLFVFLKQEFQKGYAFFATNYGGMDVKFKLDGVWHNTPAGVAHYLEHKMFDTEEGNALQDLAANGASPNAFTSNGITGYYFESTEKFQENLRTLLSFVSKPYFTQESVDKERGIIGQEIGMIEDNPEWKVYHNAMVAMYQHHPARLSIAGSVESIGEITPEVLYACHKAFYDPANMVLCVAGNVDPEEIYRIAQELLPPTPGPIAVKDYGAEEPVPVAQSLIEEHMAVSAPLFQLGCKGDAPLEGQEGQRQELLGELACEVLMGESSPLYTDLYQKGLINKGFRCGYEQLPKAGFFLAGGESKDPEKVRSALEQEARRIQQDGLDPELWKRVKRGVYGSKVRSLNSFEQLCVGQAQSFFAGGNLLDFPELFDQIEQKDVEDLIIRWVVPERLALSVVRPGEG